MSNYPSGRSVAKASGFTLLIGGIAIAIVIALSAMWVFGFGLFQKNTADFRGGVEMTEMTEGDGSFRIGAYNHFFDLCASVQEDEGRLVALNNELNTTDPSKSRKEQIHASMTAIESSRNGKIRQYNVDAQKDYTVGQFRDSGLPFELNPEVKETVCTVD